MKKPKVFERVNRRKKPKPAKRATAVMEPEVQKAIAETLREQEDRRRRVMAERRRHFLDRIDRGEVTA